MLAGLPHPDPPAVLCSLECIRSVWGVGGAWMGTTWDSNKWLEVMFHPMFLWWFWSMILCLGVIFKRHDIYRVSPFRSFSIKGIQASFRLHVYLHYLFFILFECCGVVFVSNKLCSAWFPLRAHALVTLHISCLQLEHGFVNVRSACLPSTQLKSSNSS